MSADNWSECPRCLRNNKKEAQAIITKARSHYGIVGLKVYTELVKAAEKEADELRDPVDSTPLREDYQIYTTNDGKFVISYSASCYTCGWENLFEHEEQLNLD